MKLITRDTDYAVRALCFITKQRNKIVTVSDLVRELHMPKPFLRKILQILNKKRILKSYKGVGGGFLLAKQPENIFLSDLIKAFQFRLQLNECMFLKKRCPNIANCYLRQKIDIIEKKVFRELSAINLTSLLR